MQDIDVFIFILLYFDIFLENFFVGKWGLFVGVLDVWVLIEVYRVCWDYIEQDFELFGRVQGVLLIGVMEKGVGFRGKREIEVF